MDAFPETFTPDQNVDEEIVSMNRFRKLIFDTVTKEVKRFYAIPIDSVDLKVVTKVKAELEALGWETRASEFQHLNQSVRNLHIANPRVAAGGNVRHDTFGGNAPVRAAPRQSAFARQNMGAAGRADADRPIRRSAFN